MNTPRPEPDDRIDSLVDEYFDRRRSGENLTAEGFVAEHPELADHLRPVLEGLSFLDRIGMVPERDGSDQEPGNGGTDLPEIAGYRLLEEIGRGGMGVVYKAQQAATKRVVAIKVILAGSFASMAVRRRFEREVELAARLQHPNIVRVLEGGRVEHVQYYAMDYVDGVPLDRYLATAQPGRSTTLQLFARMCEAVEYAHSRGVIHRDLKPANVLVDAEGDCHILDFGLAKAIEPGEADATILTRVTSPGQIMGTLPYVSPEQAGAAEGEIDAGTDVYALGVMLYEALTGALPFEMSGSASDVVRRILEDPPTPPSSLPQWADGELETIILKAMEKEKDRRYASARALGDDLRRYLEGEPILARRPSSLYVLRKKLRKHRLATAIGLLAVVIAVLAAAFLWAEARARQRGMEAAQRSLLAAQRIVEAGGGESAMPTVAAICEQYPQLPEAPLVYVRVQYDLEDARDDAIALLERTVRQDASRWAETLLLAEILQAAGDADRAGSLRAQAAAVTPDTANAWYLQSLATFDQQKALRCAEEAIRRQPSHTLAWIRLTCLRLDTGDLDRALRGAERLIALEPRRLEWVSLKGVVLVRLGRFGEAVEQFTAAGDYVSRANAYRRLKEFEKAVNDYTFAIRHRAEPKAAWDYYQRATPLWILGRREEALADYGRVRTLLGKPFYSDARRYLILHELSRTHEAKEVLDAALRDEEEPWPRQVYRCLAGEITPEGLIARAEESGSLQLTCEAHYYAAEVCLLAGRRDEALAHFQRCVETGLDHDPDAFDAPMNEFELAQWRLESLFADSTPAAPPEEN